MRINNTIYLIGIFLFSLVGLCHGSKGNVQPNFLGCVDHCVRTECPTMELPLSLRLTLWDCPENCQYTCMQKITDRALIENTPVYQYYGKWPFYRLWGIQEPASVLFSIGNGYVHYYYFGILRRDIPNAYYLKPFMLMFSLVGINAWIWSTVFHSRDFPLTEKLDYFSAGLFILYSLYYGVIRLFHIQNKVIIRLLTVVVTMAFLAHISYLSFYTFDYGYNMMASVIVGSMLLLLWVGWAILQYIKPENKHRRSYAYLVILSVAGTSAAMALELFDFPPFLRVFDAHSLWHFSTIPLMVLWYRFVLLDTPNEMRLGKY
ncbi:hypothetical protein INT45_008459 [Circinella minor]|uniref:Post-GPI attachment to proteins factor 3 n=1 Tax=Circinella minor TaxID=1195481 RepID=A0A8H7SCW3_9FUNG|nr:hypothetical protein INT45_008459 [Circinella minor]